MSNEKESTDDAPVTFEEFGGKDPKDEIPEELEPPDESSEE